jgi:hypothetical protein
MNILESDGPNGPPPGFVELPAEVYRDDPSWLPETPSAVAGAFSAANSWFGNGEARLFCVPGAARAAAFFQPGMRIDNRAVAFFGYWETKADDETDARLFARIDEWARARGAEILYGPINFSTSVGYRLRVSAEPGALPFLGEPYNPPDYPGRLERLGFSVAQRYVTHVAPHEGARQAFGRRRPYLDSLRKEGYRYEPLVPDLLLSRIADFHQLAHYIFGDNFAYTPIPFAAFAAQFGRAQLAKMCTRGSVIAFAPDGSIAAFMLSYPHWGPLVVQARGEARRAVSTLDYERDMLALREHPPVGLIIKTVGAHPDHRKKGVFHSLPVAALDACGEMYDQWFGALMREDNPSRRGLEGFQSGERWYALYQKLYLAST